MTAPSFKYIGRGVYSLPEAERLTGVPRRSIRRWTVGYRWTYRGRQRYSPPVIGADIAALFGAPALDFADLLEVRFLQAFRDKGVSWRTIRIASERAKELLGAEHPFSHRRFSTDGRNILAEIAQNEEDPMLLDLVRDQYELDRVVAQYLFGEIDFGPDDRPTIWFPRGRTRGVVVDPQRSMGAPIVDVAGIPTAVLAQAAEAEGSLETVAEMFDIDIRSVVEAVEFEEARGRA